MRLTLRQLLIFAAVAESGSTTAASQRVSLSQSATSAALNELERVLGARLFDRVGKRLLPPMDDRFSARRGTYRIIYRIDDKNRVVTVVDVDHRRDVYRT